MYALFIAVLQHRGKTMGIFLLNYMYCVKYAKSESCRPSGFRKVRMVFPLTVLYCRVDSDPVPIVKIHLDPNPDPRSKNKKKKMR